MNRFLNRLPTITIREGHRVKVYMTSDMQLPAYQPGNPRGNDSTLEESTMVRKIAALVVRPALVAAPAQAQFAVIDVANLAQAILIVERTQRQLE